MTKRRPDLPPNAHGWAGLRLAAGVAEGRFRLQVCAACGALAYPPREVCAGCLSDRLAWRDVEPRGRILAATQALASLHPFYQAFQRERPVTFASVALDEGPTAIVALPLGPLAAEVRVRLYARLDPAGQAMLCAVPEGETREPMPMKDANCEIKGKTVLVTGAGGGIGGALIAAFRKAGAARIIATARSVDTSAAADGAEWHPLDLTDRASVRACAEAHAEAVDILVNNAGANANSGLLDPDDEDAARDEVAVNYLGTLDLIRAVAPAMKARKSGCIVNMLSILSHATVPALGSYSASKAAALAMTEGVRAELRPWGVRVVGIFPGAVDTKMSADLPPPKIAPAAVAKATVEAVLTGVEDSYVGAMAQDLKAKLDEDRKAVEKELSAALPEPR